MKRQYNSFLVTAFLSLAGLLLNGCLNKPPCTNPGELKLKLTLSEQSASKALAGDIRILDIKLQHKNDGIAKEVRLNFTGNNQEVSLSSLYPGDWQITVSGLDDSESIIFQGTKDIFIRPGETTAVHIDLIPAPGFLNVTCDVSQVNGLAPESNGTLYVYLNPEDSATKYYTLIRDGNLIKGTVGIPEGTFEVKVAAPNVSSKIFVSPYYTVNIKAGKTTTLTIAANGSASINAAINSTPTTPGGLTAVYNSQTASVSISWNGVDDSDLNGYRLYRSNSEGRMIRIGSVDKNTTSYLNKIASTDFYHNEIKYAVSSFDQGGLESLWTDPVSILK